MFFGSYFFNLTAPVRVLLLLEEDLVAGEVGRWEEVDLQPQIETCQVNIDTSTFIIIVIKCSPCSG